MCCPCCQASAGRNRSAERGLALFPGVFSVAGKMYDGFHRTCCCVPDLSAVDTAQMGSLFGTPELCIPRFVVYARLQMPVCSHSFPTASG